MLALDPEDEIAGLHQNRRKRFLPKLNYHFLILIVGLFLGMLIQFYFITPLFQYFEPKDSFDCVESKALLNAENQCLYSLVPNAKTASGECSQRKIFNQKNKDYNEET